MWNAWDAGSREFKCEPEITELHMEIKINKKKLFLHLHNDRLEQSQD